MKKINFYLLFAFSVLILASCQDSKPKQPLSTETIDSGAVEVFCDEAYSNILNPVFDMYRSAYPKVNLAVKSVNARNALATLLAGKTRAAIIGRDNLADEDSLMKLYNVEPYYQCDIANDGLVFFANTEFPTDTLTDSIIYQMLVENKKLMDILPNIQQEPELVIAHQNSSEYGNLANLAARKQKIKRPMTLLPSSDSVIACVKQNKNAIGICYLSQVQGQFFKLLRIGFTNKDGNYIAATKPVHQSYIVMGEYPYATLLRLYLLENRKNLPFWFAIYMEKEAQPVQYYKRARLIPSYAKYNLEDERR